MTELDPRLRRQVARLHAELEPALPLGEDALQRTLAAAQRQAPQHRERASQRSRQRRTAALLLAAAVLLALVTRGLLGRNPAPEARATPVQCRLPLLASDALERLPDGRQALTLAGFGELIASSDASLRVTSTSACELRLQLEHGTLAGDLHALSPARLLVQTRAATVAIIGTRFSIRDADADDASFELVLLNGTVELALPERSALRVPPGTRVLANATNSPRSSATSARDAEQISRLLDVTEVRARAARDAPVVTQAPAPPAPPRPVSRAVPPTAARARAAVPPETSATLLQAAEAARRAQQTSQARALYRAAAAHHDEVAEVALLRWARFELDSHAPHSAQELLQSHAQRFAHGKLGAEAGWLSLQVYAALDQAESARAAAAALIEHFPGTPQADAARAWVKRR